MILKVKDNNGNWVEVPALVGNGISSISKTSGTSLPGSTDTYTISYTNGTTSTFQVYNGQDGQGTGDMTMSVYDTDKDGIVDNAEKVNNHTVNADVPSNAKFTDTTYSAMTLDDLYSGSTEERVVTAEFLGSVLGDSITYYNSSDLNSDVHLDWTLGDTTEEGVALMSIVDSDNELSIDGLDSNDYELYYEDANGNKLEGWMPIGTVEEEQG